MPVMEGKCVLFKEFGGVDAIPLCVRSKDVDDIVNTVRLLAGSFGGVNLEDISAPRCFEIEKKLKECCDIPIFHDDQHGTAVITLAGVINALKLVGKKLDEVKIVTSGAGAAGIAIIRLLISMGLKNVIMTDRKGAIYEGRDGLNPIKEEMAKITNYNHEKGTLAEVIKGADIFIGVSAPGTLTPDMVRTMAKDPIIFACANPTPEIFPDEAKAAGAAVVSTGRSDYPNQVNNVLCFPGIFRGALDVSKPFEPRNFSMVDSTGMTLLLIKEIDRPNVGCTLDFCHMLMKRDSPAYGLALAASMGKLYGLHMNDGYSQMDSGMIFGSVNIAHAAEFIYYLKKYNYQGVVFFDTFPIRENAKLETQANINSFEKISKIIDEIGMDRIAEVVSKRDGVEAQRLVLDMLK